MTVDELITLSMQEIQALADGEVPTTSEYDLGLKGLNTLVSSLQNDMVFLAYQDTQELTTVGGTSDYVTAANTYRVRGFDDTLVNVLSAKGYDQYSSDINGRTNLFVDHSTSPPTVRFCKAPSEAGSYTYRRDVLLTDFALGDDLNLVNTAREMLLLGLAFKLCGSYGVDPQTRASVNSEYMQELNKYRQAQTNRVGDEIVTPNITIV